MKRLNTTALPVQRETLSLNARLAWLLDGADPSLWSDSVSSRFFRNSGTHDASLLHESPAGIEEAGSRPGHSCGHDQPFFGSHGLNEAIAMSSYTTRRFIAKGCPVVQCESKRHLGESAAVLAGYVIRDAVAQHGRSRIIIGTDASQVETIAALSDISDIPWSEVEIFLAYECIGIPKTHPASSHYWLKLRLADRVNPKAIHDLRGDAPNLVTECDRYSKLLAAEPIDLCLFGFGDNGQIAFNGPHAADFRDPRSVKVVKLDDDCRRQQVGEGRFCSLKATPLEALTLTCPMLMRARNVIGCVSDFRRANAVKDAIDGPLTPNCPASLVFTHANASIFLDARAAALLEDRAEM